MPWVASCCCSSFLQASMDPGHEPDLNAPQSVRKANTPCMAYMRLCDVCPCLQSLCQWEPSLTPNNHPTSGPELSPTYLGNTQEHTTFVTDARHTQRSLDAAAPPPRVSTNGWMQEQAPPSAPGKATESTNVPSPSRWGLSKLAALHTHKGAGAGTMSASESCCDGDAWPWCSVRACLCSQTFGPEDTYVRLHLIDTAWHHPTPSLSDFLSDVECQRWPVRLVR